MPVPPMIARPVVIALAMLSLLAGPARAEDFERWYIVEMMGQPAGWMRLSERVADGRITSESETKIKVGRGETALTISMMGEFVETPDGKPVSMKSVQTMGQTPTTLEYTFGESEIRIASLTGEERTTSTKPLPEGRWLTPAAASRRVAELMKERPATVSLRTMDPLMGAEPTTVTRSGFEPATITVLGKPMETIKCVSTTTAAPGVESVEYLDQDGVPVRSETQMAGIAITMTMTGRVAALAAAEGGVQAPELMVSTFVKPDRAIEDPRRVSSAAYVLSVPEELPEMPMTGAQRAERLSASSARLWVDAGTPRPADAEDARKPEYLAATAMLNADDRQIRSLVERSTAVAGAAPPERAEAMRRFVHGHIRSKNLGTGFATASEVARNRQGDCSEHGVLLAAMLRADGIPSRVVSGLIYAEQFAGSRDIFGYHMWAQALLTIDGEARWVDLDATLPAGVPFDATHITLATSALEDGELQDAFIAMASLMGQLQIKVESVAHEK